MNELYDCNQYLKIPIDTLWNLPVRVRKYWIMRHNNKLQETENKNTSSTDTDRYTDLDQANLVNRNKV